MSGMFEILEKIRTKPGMYIGRASVNDFFMFLVGYKTARGTEYFDIYEGRLIVDSREFIVPVHVGSDLPEILFGRQWLSLMKLVIDEKNGILTLEYVGE